MTKREATIINMLRARGQVDDAYLDLCEDIEDEEEEKEEEDVIYSETELHSPDSSTSSLTLRTAALAVGHEMTLSELSTHEPMEETEF